MIAMTTTTASSNRWVESIRLPRFAVFAFYRTAFRSDNCAAADPSPPVIDTLARLAAYRFDGFGSLDDLRLREERDPEPQRGEVLVRVRAGDRLARIAPAHDGAEETTGASPICGLGSLAGLL